MQRKNLLFSSFVTLVIAFFLLHRFFIKTPGRLEIVASYCAYPVMVLQSAFLKSFHHYFQKNRDITALQKEIQLLQNEKEALQAHVIALENTREFVQETAELVKFKKRYEMENAQLCQIIMKRCNDKEQVLFVNAGAKQGIVLDQVAVYKNCLVGKVIQVFPHYSKIATVFDKQCKVAVAAVKSKTEGIYEGANQQEYGKLQHVDLLKKVFEQEQLYSSGQGTIFPKGFLVGEVVSFEPDGLHYSVKIKPALDISELAYCYLL